MRRRGGGDDVETGKVDAHAVVREKMRTDPMLHEDLSTRIARSPHRAHPRKVVGRLARIQRSEYFLLGRYGRRVLGRRDTQKGDGDDHRNHNLAVVSGGESAAN